MYSIDFGLFWKKITNPESLVCGPFVKDRGEKSVLYINLVVFPRKESTFNFHHKHVLSRSLKVIVLVFLVVVACFCKKLQIWRMALTFTCSMNVLYILGYTWQMTQGYICLKLLQSYCTLEMQNTAFQAKQKMRFVVHFWPCTA